MAKTKILVIVGTTREGRKGRLVADWYIREVAKAGLAVDVQLLDLADEKIELFNEPVSPMAGKYTAVQNRLADMVSSADGIVMVTAEYNHSVPASLKNMIDHLYAEWAYRPVAFVGYGGHGGVRAIEHLVQIMTELRALPVASTKTNVTIRAIWEAFDDKNELKPGYMSGDPVAQLSELLKLAEVVKPLRTS